MMKSRMYGTRFVVLFLFLFLIASPAVAQHFTATRITPAAGDVLAAEGPAYTLDLNALHAYAAAATGDFPLTLAFADTLSWTMQLEPYDVRRAGYRLVTSRGEIHDRSNAPVVTYRGHLQGDSESRVRMTIAENFVRAYVQDAAGTVYYLESETGTTGGTRVTLNPGAEDTLAGYCAATEAHNINAGDQRKAGFDPHRIQHVQAPFETEIAFAVDRTAYAQYESLEDLELELLTILNYTDAYYEVHQITYRLTETFVVVDLESQPWDEFDDAGLMLDAFTDWANDAGSLAHHDVATLWTGISFGSTIGIAWIDVIGSSHRQNVVNFPDARERRNANVHAHELGHNWGSSHVNSSGWIMSAALSNADSEKEWHESVIDAFPGYLQEAIAYLDDLNETGGALPVGIAEVEVADEMNNNALLDPGETANINLVIENLESEDIENMQVSMFNDNNRAKNHVTINTAPLVVDMLPASSEVTVSFNVTLSAEAPTDRSLRFLYEIADETRVVELTATIVSGEESLPVDLTAFDALMAGETVQLNWETASETNNARFEVEAGFNGGDFEPIGFVAGAGTTLEPQTYAFATKALAAGTYAFRLKQVDFDGAFEYSDVVYVALLPQQYSLKQNYPNPFNPQTRIAFQLPAARDVTLEVFDLLGRRVAALVDGPLDAGDHAITFNAANLPNGTYLYRLRAGGFEEMKSMVLLK